MLPSRASTTRLQDFGLFSYLFSLVVNHLENVCVEDKHKGQRQQETHHNTDDVVNEAQAQFGPISRGEVIKPLPGKLYERHKERKNPDGGY